MDHRCTSLERLLLPECLRMLLLVELVMGFESHVGWTFSSLFAKIENQRNPTAESAHSSSVGRRNSMRVDEGRNCWSLLAMKNEGAYSSGEGGEKSLLFSGP